MDHHVRKSFRLSNAVFWRRRVLFLLAAGVLVGMVFWPLDGWLFGSAQRDAAARQAALQQHETAGSDKSSDSGGDERADSKADDKQNGRPAGDRSAGTRAAGKRQAAEQGQPHAGKPKAAGDKPKAAAGDSTGDPAGRQDEDGPRQANVPVCDGEALTVTVRPDQDSAPAGRPMSFRLRVRNGGEQPCRVPPEPSQVRVAVLTGSDRVLDTEQCPATINARPARVKPGKSGIVTVRWNGQQTARDCSADAPSAEPGSYSVQASVLGAFSAPAPFQLR